MSEEINANTEEKEIVIEDPGQALDMAQLNSLVELFDPSIKESIYTKQIEQKIYAIKATEAGQAFIDFSLPDSTGKMIHLSELVSRGNYLVVDFWSTWSGSSLLEIENDFRLIHVEF